MTVTRGEGPTDIPGLLREAEVLRRNGSLTEAERRYRQALRLQPAHYPALSLLGGLLAEQGRYAEAASTLERALELNPGDPDAGYNLGVALQRLGRHARAIEALRASMQARGPAADALIHIGISLAALERHGEAAKAYEEAVSLDAQHAVAFDNLGTQYRHLGRCRDAVASFRQALELRAARSNPTEEDVAAFARSFDDYLLTLNYLEDHDEAGLLREHRRYGEQFARAPSAAAIDQSWPQRLRIGYVSPDFRAHSVSFFFEPVLARHDRSRFEIFCYDDCTRPDAVNRRLRGLAEHWIESAALSDAGLARRIGEDRINILVDLAGHTGGNRLLVFARKPAPLQISYLGYPGAVGLPTIDYRITDARADPPSEQDRVAAERPLRLSPSYFCYRPPADAPEPAERAASDPIVFGCFSTVAKLSDELLTAFAQLLAALRGSRLVLKSAGFGDPHAIAWTRQRMGAKGMDNERIEIRPADAELQAHLAAYRSVDIALDTFPYNGATTICEALWMGVPVVALEGDRHPGRMAASLLHAAGLGELVAGDVAGYVATAIALATDPARLNRLRRTLRAQLAVSPVMDEVRFARALEERYVASWSERTRAP